MKALRNILIRLARVAFLFLATLFTIVLSPIILTVAMTTYVLTGKDLFDWYIDLLNKIDDKFNEMIQ